MVHLDCHCRITTQDLKRRFFRHFEWLRAMALDIDRGEFLSRSLDYVVGEVVGQAEGGAHRRGLRRKEIVLSRLLPTF